MMLFWIVIIFAIESQCLSWNIINNTLPYGLSRSAFTLTQKNDILYIFGGLTGNKIYSNKIFKWWMINDTTSKWNELDIKTPIKMACDGQCSVSINDSIYIIAPTINQTSNSNIIWKFNITLKKWILNLNNTFPKSINNSACITTNNTHIFVFGGYINNPPDFPYTINDTQIYNIQQDTWSEGKPVPISAWQGWEFGSCVYHEKTNRIYIFGGQAGAGGDWFQRIWSYDTLINNWTQSQRNLKVPRSGVSLILNEDKIYIIGGFGNWSENPNGDGRGYSYYGTVDIYNPETDTINNGTELIKSRAFSIGFINNSRMYMLGGEYWRNFSDPFYFNNCEVQNLLTSNDNDNVIDVLIFAGFVAFIIVSIIAVICHKNKYRILPIQMEQSLMHANGNDNDDDDNAPDQLADAESTVAK